MEYKFDSNDQREFAKKSLESFAETRENNFDPAIGRLLQELRIRKSESGDRLDASGKKLPGLVSEDQEISWEDAQIYQEQAQAMLEYSYSFYELSAILEMQIVYAFKHLEIGMRTAIMANYKVTKNDISDWDRVKSFLKGFGINLASLNAHHQVNQLRQVNNNLKHDSKIDKDKLSGIKEFAGKTRFEPDDLELFYKRIKDSPKKFLIPLSDAILNERYTFDNNKIAEMANELHRRMDKLSAESLATALLKLY